MSSATWTSHEYHRATEESESIRQRCTSGVNKVSAQMCLLIQKVLSKFLKNQARNEHEGIRPFQENVPEGRTYYAEERLEVSKPIWERQPFCYNEYNTHGHYQIACVSTSRHPPSKVNQLCQKLERVWTGPKAFQAVDCRNGLHAKQYCLDF